MSRYIDAEALKDKINTAFWSEIGKIVDDEPSIDIVRCKECKHWHELHGCIKNDDINLCTNPDDYCSYGEREGE